MDNVVEMRDSSVPKFRTRESEFSLHLGTEVTQENYCWLVRSQEQRANQEIGGGESCWIAGGGGDLKRQSSNLLTLNPNNSLTWDPPCRIQQSPDPHDLGDANRSSSHSRKSQSVVLSISDEVKSVFFLCRSFVTTLHLLG